MALSKIINGGVAASALPSGSIIQVKHTQLTVTGSQAISSANTDTLVSGFTVNITPTSTSSIIQLTAQIFGEFDNTSSPHNTIFYFMRDSTKLAHTGTIQSNQQAGVSMLAQAQDSSSVNVATTPEVGFISFFDTPSTTSQITYKLGFRSKQTATFHINRTVNDANATSEERGTSFISATEIAG